MNKTEEKAWEDLTIGEKLEAMGFDGGQSDKTIGDALDSFSDTMILMEEIEELIKSAVADESEQKNVIDAIAKLLAE